MPAERYSNKTIKRNNNSMRLTINDKQIIFPSSLLEITLQQKIDYSKEHTPALEKMAQQIEACKDELEKSVLTSEFEHEKMLRDFSFFAGVDLESLRNESSEIIDKVAGIYYPCMAVINEEANDLKPETEFFLKGQMWELRPPEDDGKFNSFLFAKQMTKHLINLSKGDWSAMLPICAAYIRKKDEAFDPQFIEEGSDRIEMMRELPMYYVMQVNELMKKTMDVHIAGASLQF